MKLTNDTMCAVSTRSSVDIASLAFTRARGLSSRRRIPQNLWGNGRNGILRLYPCSSVHKKHAETTIETAFSKWHCVQTIASEYVASYRTMYKHVCHKSSTRVVTYVAVPQSKTKTKVQTKPPNQTQTKPNQQTNPEDHPRTTRVPPSTHAPRISHAPFTQPTRALAQPFSHTLTP